MKTLIVSSHPDLQESSSHVFLKESLPKNEAVTFRHLESIYPDGIIDRARECQLVLSHDRIIFQFPLYWYSSPALLKKWQDEVLTELFSDGSQESILKGKEVGIVVTVGVAQKEYQVGGKEGITISELLAPFQAIARKFEMIFLKPLPIFQFHYFSEPEKMALFLSYQQYLLLPTDSLREKEKWFLAQFEQLRQTVDSQQTTFLLDHLIAHLEENRMEIDELLMHIEEAK